MPIPMPQQSSAGNFRLFGGAVSPSAFRKAAAPIDFQHIIDRGPKYGDEATLKVLYGEPGVGVVGFEMFQPRTGLTYTARYYDDRGNDACGVTVSVPQGRPYLHRRTDVGLAEKGYILSLMHYLLDKREPLLKSGMIAHLSDIEDACKLSTGGTLEIGPAVAVNLRPMGKVVAHRGLSFDTDSQYKNTPDNAIMALEWVQGQNHFVIDCSQNYPRFTVRDANNSFAPAMCLTCAEAKAAIVFVKAKAQTDPAISYLANVPSLWVKLENAANVHDAEVRIPAPI